MVFVGIRHCEHICMPRAFSSPSYRLWLHTSRLCLVIVMWPHQNSLIKHMKDSASGDENLTMNFMLPCRESKQIKEIIQALSQFPDCHACSQFLDESQSLLQRLGTEHEQKGVKSYLPTYALFNHSTKRYFLFLQCFKGDHSLIRML